MSKLRSLAPEIPTANILKSIEYYRAKLGFHLVMTMPEGDYAVVERDDVAIHLFQATNNNAPVSMQIFTEGLDQIHAELASRGAQIKQGIESKPWGNRDFRVLDDFGNELKFTER